MLQVEQVLQGRYQLQKQLGNNAGRQTWLAVDLATQTRERVIVKLLPFSPQLHWDDLKLFEREAQVLKHLNHPCIPKYRDYFSTKPSNSDELPWFGLVQDYIQGDSLQQFLNKGKRFTEAGVKEIAIQLLEILIYLHQLSPAVLHRDIKPSNIIWGKNHQVYLVDFGAVQEKAKAEGATFTVVGTGGYAPPEQLWGKAVPASDLYALGATLIHLLTGTAPADLPQRQMRLQFRDKVSLTPSFAHWLETLTNPDPQLRFSNASGALEALQASGSPSSSLETATTASEGTNRKARQRTINIVVLQYVVLFCAIAIAIAGDFLSGMVRNGKQAEGRQNVGAMNRAQEAYFLDNNEFSASIQELDIGMKTQTQNYQYSIRATPLAVFNYATPREKHIKGHVGAVFLTSADKSKGEIVTVQLMCETNSPSWLQNWFNIQRPAEPIVRGNVVECPPNTKSLSGTPHNDTERFVLGKDSALAYHSLNYAVAGQYDQALQVVKTIKHPHFKARALAAVAHQLAEKGQYNQALEVAKTIKDESVKQIALKAIARYKNSP
jgi:serine/threonine protein kinase